MKCPYCAEEIQNEAILCRFCGATKAGELWTPPVPPAPPSPPTLPPQAGAGAARKSNFTIRTAAAFFLLSALVEALSVNSAIPLFGAVRGGAVAAGYHMVYIGLFAAMGFGLWQARPWGYKIVLAATLFYSLDKALYLTDHQGRTAELTRQLQEYGVQDMIDPITLINGMNLVTVATLACWWGFMLYLYLRRNDFKAPSR